LKCQVLIAIIIIKKILETAERQNKGGFIMKNLEHSYDMVRPYIPMEVLMPESRVELCRLSGFAASSGIVEGPCKIIRDMKDLQLLTRGAIAVFEAALPAVTPFMHLPGGLITERGGSLSIASRYARMYEIPAVIGVDGLMNTIKDGDVVRVDGSKGTVDIIG
jgi:pyruvate,water dikinase